MFFELLLLPRSGQRSIARNQILPLEILSIAKRGDIRLPGLDSISGGRVCNGRCVVFVGQPREVMPEFVNEDIGRLSAVSGDRAVEVEYAASSIGPRVRNYLYELVRRERCNGAHRAVVKGKDVSLGSEGVVACSERRLAIDAG